MAFVGTFGLAGYTGLAADGVGDLGESGLGSKNSDARNIRNGAVDVTGEGSLVDLGSNKSLGGLMRPSQLTGSNGGQMRVLPSPANIVSVGNNPGNNGNNNGTRGPIHGNGKIPVAIDADAPSDPINPSEPGAPGGNPGGYSGRPVIANPADVPAVFNPDNNSGRGNRKFISMDDTNSVVTPVNSGNEQGVRDRDVQLINGTASVFGGDQ